MFRSYLAIWFVVIPELGKCSDNTAETCERLGSLTLPNTTVTMARLTAAGTFVLPGVTGTPNANLILRQPVLQARRQHQILLGRA